MIADVFRKIIDDYAATDGFSCVIRVLHHGKNPSR